MRIFAKPGKPAAVLCLLVALPLSALAADKLSPEKAGPIGEPTGKIAFVRNGNVWIMDADGAKQKLICEVSNADGRLSWSPDNKQIIFTRSGFVDLKGPDMLGGRHKVYDLFLCYPDSAFANNLMFWYRLTDDLGNRDPEWSTDGSRIIFWKDMRANTVNAFAPNYQLCTMEPDGTNIELLRKDWQTFYEDFMISPSMNQKGDIAFVYFQKQRPVGLGLLSSEQIMMPIDSIKKMGYDNKGFVAPAWSPDGKWIAVVSNDLDDAGLYLFSADLKEKYLVAAPPVGTYLNTLAPSFSPDSKWITFSTTDGPIWICDIAGNGTRRLTGPGPDKAPAWSK